MSSSLLLHRRGRWGGALVAALLLAAPVVGAPAAGADTEVSFITKPDSVVEELSDTTKPEEAEAGTATIAVLNSTSSATDVRVTISAPPMYGPLDDGKLHQIDDPKIGIHTAGAADVAATGKDFAETRIAPGQTAEFDLWVSDAYTASFTLVASTGGGAEATMAVPDRADPKPPTTSAWGQGWWDKDLVPALQLGMEVLLLLLVVSVVANWIADEARPVWRRRWCVRPGYFRLTGYAVVVAGGLRLLLLHAPDDRSALANSIASWLESNWWRWWGAAAVILVGLAVLLWVFAVYLAQSPVTNRFLHDRDHAIGWALGGGLVAIGAFAFAGWRLDKGAGQPWWSSIGLGLVLIVVGTVLIAWQSAYHVRLRLSSGNDKDETWPIRRERLAAELIGPEGQGQHRVTISGAADASPLTDDALAAASGSAVLKAIVAVVTAVVPHAGLELRVTSLGAPDAGDEKAAKADPVVHLAASLSRGRNEIAAVEVDSRTLHPASERVDAVRHDSELDAVSAVAAWARWKIGKEMKHPAWSLYGADSWLGMALQQAGARRDDAGEHKSARILFARARGEDAGNLQAWFNVLSSSVSSVFSASAHPDAPKLLADVHALDETVRQTYPGTQLALRTQYLHTTVHLYAGETKQAGEAAAGLLFELHALDADPFPYLPGVSGAARAEILERGRQQTTEGETIVGMRGGGPRGLERDEVREFARFLAPSAAVLYVMTVDKSEWSEVVLKALAALPDLPHRARYNVGCALVALGRYPQGWTEISDAMAMEHLGYWALRDPSLRLLWRQPDPSSKEGKTYLDLYVERLEDLGRKPRLEKGSALVEAGLDTGLVLKLAKLHEIDSFDKMKAVDPSKVTGLTDAQRKTLAAKQGTLALAAVPAIGAANAALLATAGITSIPSLLATSTGQVVERVAAAGLATEKDTTKLTYTTVRGWQLAARDEHPPHHEIVGIMTGDGTVVLVES